MEEVDADAFFADRSERGKLRFRGPQRAWFLHQILTQSIEDLAPGDARDAAMITAHGRMTGYLEIVATEDALLAHFEAGLRAVLPEEIARYVFATQVVIEDVSEDMGLVLLGGEARADVRPAGALVHATSALGEPAEYLWIERQRVDEVLDELARRGAVHVQESDLEAMRVANGVPRWGRDMDDRTIPQEVGVDALAVHYDKGCYLGQEAMAKIHFRGKVNRSLRRLESRVPLAPGADVVVDGARVGRVTSVAGRRALAVVRHTVRPGETVVSDGAEATVVG
jgi:tRNA-modifying protein YgfZ